MQSLVAPASRSVAGDALASLGKGGRVSFEADFTASDGTVLPAEVSASHIVLDGQPAIQQLVRDISDRRRAEAELHEARVAERRMAEIRRIVSETQKSFIAGDDMCGVFAEMLRDMLAMTQSERGCIVEVILDDDGNPEPDVLAQSTPAWLVQPSPDVEERGTFDLVPVLEAVRTRGEPVIWTEHVWGDGPQLKSVLALPFLQGENLVGMAVFANRAQGYDPRCIDSLDVFRTTCATIIEAQRSEERRAASEENLREAEAQLRQAQKLEALGALAGGVAHDFNNLLTSIIAFAELVREDLPAAHPGKQDLREVLRAAASATRLTAQLLSFARRRPVEPQVFDAREGVRQAEKMLRRTLGEHIELVVEFDDDPLPVRVDVGALDQLIFNLSVNARDAMPDGGTITLAVEQRVIDGSDYAAIVVTDTGVGIPDDVIGRIFDPFFSTKGGARNGARARHLLRHRQAGRRRDLGRVDRGRGHDLYRRAAACAGRGDPDPR